MRDVHSSGELNQHGHTELKQGACFRVGKLTLALGFFSTKLWKCPSAPPMKAQESLEVLIAAGIKRHTS